MNDRYLFRGRRVDGGGWVIGCICPFALEDLPDGLRIRNEHGGWHTVKIDPATIGQCVGLRDRNGTLIWEGDVVKTKEYGKNSGKGTNFSGYDVFAIVFHINAFCIENGTESSGRRFGLSGCFDKCEITGNIHDNPELLEGR